MSSFQKRKTTFNLPGTKVSLQNGQQLLSTGNAALDFILGGGLPIGSILLIEEDKMVRYSEYLVKFFLTEGIVHKHGIFLASLDMDPREIMQKLPAIVEDKGKSTTNLSVSNQTSDEMRIAWRYNNLEKINSEQGGEGSDDGKIGYLFDVSQQIDKDILNTVDSTLFDDNELIDSIEENSNSVFRNQLYVSLVDKLKAKLNSEQFKSNNGNPSDSKESQNTKNILRVCLKSFCSPLWYDENYVNDVCLFLTVLKSLMRQSLSVCCITIPAHLLKNDENLIFRIRNLVDFSIELESFAGSDKETNPIFKEYHGLLHIKKLMALNALAAHSPETYDLAFKLRRKRFVIEKLHLPPELQESEQREQQDNEHILSSLSCGSTKNILDF